VAVEAALRAVPGVEEVTLSAIHREMARQAGLDAEAARRAEAAEIACEMAPRARSPGCATGSPPCTGWGSGWRW
jgi:hypothetical protein